MSDLDDRPKCIATGDVLNSENDSEAHVIPNAIGGRLKPTGILSRAANSRIGDCVEAPFFKGYQQIISLIGGKRQRGKHPSFRVEGPDGKTYLFDPQGSLTPAQPEYISNQTDHGEVVEIKARTMEEAKTLLGKITKQYPHFDVEEALSRAQPVSQPSPQVKISLSVGPKQYFPLSYISAGTFNASRGLKIHPSFKEYFGSLKKGAATNLPMDTFYWEPDVVALNIPNPGVHLVTTIASRKRAKLLTVVKLIGLPGVATITPYDGNRALSCTYAVDVVQGIDIRVNVDAPKLASYDWSPTHVIGEELRQLQTKLIGNVLDLAVRLGTIA